MGRTGFSRLTRVGSGLTRVGVVKGVGVVSRADDVNRSIGCTVATVHMCAGPVIGQPARKNVNPGVGGSGRPRDFFRRGVYSINGLNPRGAVTR